MYMNCFRYNAFFILEDFYHNNIIKINVIINIMN